MPRGSSRRRRRTTVRVQECNFRIVGVRLPSVSFVEGGTLHSMRHLRRLARDSIGVTPAEVHLVDDSLEDSSEESTRIEMEVLNVVYTGMHHGSIRMRERPSEDNLVDNENQGEVFKFDASVLVRLEPNPRLKLKSGLRLELRQEELQTLSEVGSRVESFAESAGHAVTDFCGKFF